MRQSAGTPPALLFRGALTVELCSMVKCALWGLRVEPLQGHAGVHVSLRFFTCCVPSPRPKKRCVMQQGAGARAYLHEEACTVARHPHPLASRAALRLWLFLGCNRISGQTQNDIASPCTAILRLACHRVWLYQEF